MTRETKIGLLVGLAFIVVFAMLLSHTGTVPPPGDGLRVVRSEPVTLALADRAVESGPVQPARPAAVASSPRLLMPAESMLQLPSPVELETQVRVPEVVDAGSGSQQLWAPERTPALIESVRVAPPLPPEPLAEPIPTPRVNLPERSPAPADPVRPMTPTPAPTPVPATPREYIVKKGETLGHIAQAMYNTAAPRVVDYLMQTNRIRNRDFVVEGQKLVIPDLPPDLFEPVATLNVAQMEARTATLEELINSPGETRMRQAPPLRNEDRPNGGRNEGVREYEVKAKDTFTSIAREELGSVDRWKEIEKLNKDVDPKRMQPGMKIKLPPKRPPAGAMASGGFVASR